MHLLEFVIPCFLRGLYLGFSVKQEMHKTGQGRGRDYLSIGEGGGGMTER
jgi:hypothetical protein